MIIMSYNNLYWSTYDLGTARLETVVRTIEGEGEQQTEQGEYGPLDDAAGGLVLPDIADDTPTADEPSQKLGGDQDEK